MTGTFWQRGWIAAIGLLAALNFSAKGRGAEPDPRRLSDTVRLVNACLPAVVSVRSEKPGKKPNEIVTDHGSGFVIHPSGYILSIAHGLRDSRKGEVELSDRRVFPVRIIARSHADDLAILKIDPPAPLPVLPLGRSHDLMLGESALVIGNAAQLGNSVSTGVISGLHRATASEFTYLSESVQTTAAINGGNSGGPLINAVGQAIGVVVSKKSDAESVGFAIAIDHVRKVFPRLVGAEARGGFVLGVQLDMLEPTAVVRSVAADSPAAKAKLAAGCVIASVGGQKITSPLDFHLALLGRRAGEELDLQYRTADSGELQTAKVQLAEWPLAPAVEEGKREAGLDYSVYLGSWPKLPDIRELKPTASGKAQAVSLDGAPKDSESFAMRFRGYLRAPADGMYTLSLKSDDGSRLWLDGKLVIDSDGQHGAVETPVLLRLKSGLHRLQLDYFQAGGERSLRMFWEGPEMPRQEVPAAALFSDPKP